MIHIINVLLYLSYGHFSMKLRQLTRLNHCFYIYQLISNNINIIHYILISNNINIIHYILIFNYPIRYLNNWTIKKNEI